MKRRKKVKQERERERERERVKSQAEDVAHMTTCIFNAHHAHTMSENEVIGPALKVRKEKKRRSKRKK